jgi:F0F1-type ATP synthase gamma subunit
MKELIGAVVFGSDQGLVGRFNEVIVEFAVHKLKTLPGKTTKIWAVGDRAHALLADTGMAPVDCYRFRPRSMPSRRLSARFSSKSRRLSIEAMS